MKNHQQVLRILIADDEKAIWRLYRQTLCTDKEDVCSEEVEALADRLFGTEKADTPPAFELKFRHNSYDAVETIKKAITDDKPFAVAFLDIRMPPGPDGVWAAEQIRKIDPNIEIVMITGFSDIHPLDIARRVPPAHKLLYVQKPLHAHEISQLATALGKKWQLEQQLRLTEKKKRELEIQLRMSQKLEAIGTLAGGIAHDFNNILSSIIGNAEIALHHELPPDHPARNSIEQILKGSHRARNLVHQIMTFSRQKEQEFKPFNIIPIIKETIKLIRASFPATIEIHQKITADEDTVLCEPGQIQQILMNLCTNAAYAMRNSGGILEIKLTDAIGSADMGFKDNLGAKPYVKLIVSDTGCGMPASIRERIFEPYFTTKPFGEGTGLGLSVVHGIVKNLNGKIRVDSTPGKGSTFSILLPVVEKKKIPTVTEISEEIPTGTERILLIDNEPFLVDMGKRMLRSLGYTVTAMTDSTDALKMFSSDPAAYDLVITDLTMPGMTGDRLAQELLRIRPDIPIILCTGYSETITEEDAKRLGIRKFVFKPVVMKDLSLIIRNVLKSKSN